MDRLLVLVISSGENDKNDPCKISILESLSNTL